MAKKMRGKRLGKDVRDLVLRVDIDELESLHFMQIAQVMILEEHVLAAFVIDRITGLCNTGFIVFMKYGGGRLGKAHFFKEVAVIHDSAAAVKGRDVLRFSRRESDSGLNGRRPIN